MIFCVTTLYILAVSWHFLLNYFLKFVLSLNLQDGIFSPFSHIFSPFLIHSWTRQDLLYTNINKEYIYSLVLALVLCTLGGRLTSFPQSLTFRSSDTYISQSSPYFKLAVTQWTAVLLFGFLILQIGGVHEKSQFPWSHPHALLPEHFTGLTCRIHTSWNS